MPNDKHASPTVINTRPAPMGLELESHLHQAGINTLYQPALENRIIPNAVHDLSIEALFESVLIFVSRPSVDALYQQLTLQPSLLSVVKHHKNIVAIGKGTAAQLSAQFDLSMSSIKVPEKYDSEHLLTLPIFDHPTQVIVFKGVGGRPLIKQELQKRGCQISEWPLYERLVTAYPDAPEEWQVASIILVTSTAVASSAIASLQALDSPQQRPIDLNKWQWLSFSDRIKQELLRHGIHESRIYTCEQMDNSSIIKNIKRLAK